MVRGIQAQFDMTRDQKRWQGPVLAFCRAHPGMNEERTVASYRFLESLGAIPPEVADELCRLHRLRTIPAPATISRIIRDAERHGLLRSTPRQRELHAALEEEMRHEYDPAD